MIDLILAAIATPAFAIVWSGFTFALGAWFGHYLSRNWDRTKEFNAIAGPLYAQLMSEHNDIHVGQGTPILQNMIIAGEMMSARKRDRFHGAMAAYQEARKQHIVADSAGGRSYSQTEHIAHAIRHLMSFLKRK